MDGNQFKEAVRDFIQQTISDLQIQTGQSANESGVVTAVNPDGTITVQTASGVYTGCGTPVRRVMGENVILVTADQQKVAL